MKKSLALSALVFALCSSLGCEQHTWEQTKMFNQNRHAPGHGGSHAEHGTPNGSHAAPAAGHGTKPAAPH